MKNYSFGVIWLGLLCSGYLSFADGKEFIIDEATDGILLNCAIAFLVLCAVFLILVIAISLFVYRGMKDRNPSPRKGYDVSIRDVNEPKTHFTSGPFHGHGVYTSRPESSIYLPGRESAYMNSKPDKVAVYENEGFVMNNNEKRDSPPTEKGQVDAKVREKTATVKTTYDNPAFENPAYQSLADNEYESLDSHDYEMLDAAAIAKRGEKAL